MKKGIHPSRGCAAPAKRAGRERYLSASVLLSRATPCLQESLFHTLLCPTCIPILSAEAGGCEGTVGQSRGLSQDKVGLQSAGHNRPQALRRDVFRSPAGGRA